MAQTEFWKLYFWQDFDYFHTSIGWLLKQQRIVKIPKPNFKIFTVIIREHGGKCLNSTHPKYYDLF